MAAVADLADMADELNSVATNSSLDPADRVVELRRLRDRIGDEPADRPLLGQCEMYIADLELQREGQAAEGQLDRARLREDADVRDLLVARGIATDEELVAAGWPGHDDLDRAADDGSLVESTLGTFKEVLHPRSRTGEWRDKPGVVSMHGRGGGAVSDAAKMASYEPPKPMKSPLKAVEERWPHLQAVNDASQAVKQGDASGHAKLRLARARAEGASVTLDPHHRPVWHAHLAAAEVGALPPEPVATTPDVAREHIDAQETIQARVKEAERLGLDDWPEKDAVAARALGEAKDTQEKHTFPLPASPGTEGAEPKRAYSMERKTKHDEIVGEALAGAVGHILGENHPITEKLKSGQTLTDEEKATVRAAAPPKRALFLAGGPASGKTSALKASPELEPPGAVTINPDDIKERLPEYNDMLHGQSKYAATGVHEESSDLGKRLQSEAMELGLPVVVDGTGDSKKGKFTGKMQDMHDAGYDVSGMYVTIPTDEAVVRATKRAMESGRWVPTPELRSQHEHVSANFPDVAALPFLSDLKLYDNAGDGDPVLVSEGRGGKLTIHDQARHTEFLAKAGGTGG